MTSKTRDSLTIASAALIFASGAWDGAAATGVSTATASGPLASRSREALETRGAAATSPAGEPRSGFTLAEAGAGDGLWVSSVASPPVAASPLAPGVPPQPRPDAAPSAGENSARWSWPISGTPRVHRKFEPPAHAYGAGHRGIDVSGTDARVRSVESGVVHFSGSVAGKPVVSIRHSDGLLSTYEPVRGTVRRGESVAEGDVIGELIDNPALSHCEDRCLHLGARMGSTYIDPLPLLGARGPSVLYPR